MKVSGMGIGGHFSFKSKAASLTFQWLKIWKIYRAALNHSEFVAEVFAALMLGRTELLENESVMDNSTRFGGESIRQYDVNS